MIELASKEMLKKQKKYANTVNILKKKIYWKSDPRTCHKSEMTVVFIEATSEIS